MPTDTTPLTAAALQQFVAAHPGWALEGGPLKKTFEFPAFLTGIAFVQRLAAVAEALAHHPDLDVRYTRVTARLFTHDADALTALDLELAGACDRLAAELGAR